MGIVATVKEITRHPLNQTSRLGAVCRFARWQLASRLIRSPIALPFVEGTSLLTARGMTSATGNWYCGLFEPEAMAFVLHSLRPGDLFVDIGANIGAYSIMAAGAVGADVLAIEPVPETFAQLVANVRFNGLEVDARQCGVSSERGEIHFTTAHGCQNKVASPAGTESTIAVRVEKLDAICSRTPAIIKIDVEGHEPAVLEGAKQILSSSELRAVVMENGGDGRVAIVTAAGFTACAYNWRERTVFPAPITGYDTIYVRDPDVMTTICRSARRFKLVNGWV